MIRIRWFPASWILIETKHKVIYIDPAWVQNNFASYPSKVIYSHYPDPMDGLPERDLPKADIILITHHHQDHVKTATINRLSAAKTEIYATALSSELVGRKYTVVKPGDSFDMGWISVKAVFAYNTKEGHSTHKVHHKGDCVGYVISIDGKTVYHAGDTDQIKEMEDLERIDVAFLPVGGTFTMDIDEAISAAKQIKPKYFIPMHYLHCTQDNIQKEIEKAQIQSTSRILSIGEQFEL